MTMSQPRADDHDAGDHAPPAEVLEAMRCHAQEAHGATLAAERDVHGLAAEAADTWLTWEAQSFARPARYWCARCPGRVFGVGDPPYGDPERNAFLRRSDPTIAALTAGLPPDEQEALTEAYDRRELGRALAETIGARAGIRTKRPGAPADVQRIERCQAALLAHVSRGLTVEEALDELESLYRTDPQEQRRIFGREMPYARATIMSYWKGIPIVGRNAARAHGQSRPPHELNAERARRRSGKLTP
jgi:hypothetical protein